MPRTWNEVEKLWHRIYEIDDLRDEKQQNCLAEMSQNSNNSERHSGKIVERVTDEDLRRISRTKIETCIIQEQSCARRKLTY